MQKPGNDYSEKNDQHVFEIIIRDRAFKQLESIPKKFFEKLDNLIISLANNPYPHGVKKLQGYENVYCVRYADYRVVYAGIIKNSLSKLSR